MKKTIILLAVLNLAPSFALAQRLPKQAVTLTPAQLQGLYDALKASKPQTCIDWERTVNAAAQALDEPVSEQLKKELDADQALKAAADKAAQDKAAQEAKKPVANAALPTQPSVTAPIPRKSGATLSKPK